MQRVVQKLGLWLWLIAISASSGFAQKTLTWQEVRDKFRAANPTLRAGQIGIDESQAQEITANLRPNPNLTILMDQAVPNVFGSDDAANRRKRNGRNGSLASLGS